MILLVLLRYLGHTATRSYVNLSCARTKTFFWNSDISTILVLAVNVVNPEQLYANQLTQLQEMGFYDREVSCLEILQCGQYYCTRQFCNLWIKLTSYVLDCTIFL